MEFAKIFSRSAFFVFGILLMTSSSGFLHAEDSATGGATGGLSQKNDQIFIPAYAPGTVNLNKGQFDIHPSNINNFESFGSRFIHLLTGIVIMIAILVFMIGAGFWIFSAGNESLVERGKDMMIYTIIGLLFVLGAYVVVKVVQVILYALGT